MIALQKIGIGFAALVGCAMALPAAAQPKPDVDALERQLSGRSVLEGAELDRALDAAAAHPLGSRENPVRAAMPEGQRAYLARLRCADGRAPQFRRTGNLGPGIYGNIVDHYDLRCSGSAPAESSVVMDMYHPNHAEQRPVPGFTIVPDADQGVRLRSTS